MPSRCGERLLQALSQLLTPHRQNLVATDRDSDAALSLAEAYLDGVGTSRDPIEAAVILWRVQHGAWSIYNDYWGMCIE